MLTWWEQRIENDEKAKQRRRDFIERETINQNIKRKKKKAKHLRTIELAKDGYSYKEIALKVGLTSRWVSKIVRDNLLEGNK